MIEHKKDLPIWKITPYLRGIAILAVLINHSAYYSSMDYLFYHYDFYNCYIAPFNLPLKIFMPGWIVIQELTRFCVPLFILLIGYHVSNFGSSWKALIKQIKIFLMPYLFWSFFGLLTSFIEHNPWSIKTLLLNLLTGTSQPGYYFIPLLFQYYIISKFIVLLVKNKPKLILIASLIIQIVWICNNYLAYAYQGEILSFVFFKKTLPEYLFPRFIFFYVFGIWISNHSDKLKMIIKNYYFILLSVILSALLTILEHSYLFNIIQSSDIQIEKWRVFSAMSQWKLSTMLWSFCFILYLIKLGQKKRLSFTFLQNLGNNSYNIYILNGPIFYVISIIHKNIFVSQNITILLFFIYFTLALIIPKLLNRILNSQHFLKKIILGNYRR